MREPPGPCGAGRLRCVCRAGPLCVPVGGGPPRGLLPRQISGRRVACFVGPGRCVCRWAAARPRDRHTRAWRLGVVDLEARPGPATAHRHRDQALQTPRRPPIGRGSLSVYCLPWPRHRSPAPWPGPAAAHRHRDQALPPPINFACNSPPPLCWFVSVCSVVSLVFLNCMRLLLSAGPACAHRHRAWALRTLSALCADESGCVCG